MADLTRDANCVRIPARFINGKVYISAVIIVHMAEICSCFHGQAFGIIPNEYFCMDKLIRQTVAAIWDTPSDI